MSVNLLALDDAVERVVYEVLAADSGDETEEAVAYARRRLAERVSTFEVEA